MGILFGGFSPNHLKNMRQSIWIISPGFRLQIQKKIFELPPSRYIIRHTELPENLGLLNR